MMKIKEVVLECCSMVVKIGLFVWNYAPVYFGMVIGMISFIAIGIPYLLWQILYFPYIPFLDENRWINGFIFSVGDKTFGVEVPFWQLLPVIYTLEAILFIGGAVLFFTSIFYLVKGRKKGIKIVTDGPYNYIRHPQHIALMMMLIPFYFSFPFIGGSGYFRPLDVFAYLIFILILMIISDVEDYRLHKKHPEEFRAYRTSTPAFVPRVSNKQPIFTRSWIPYVGKYLVWVLVMNLIYWGFILLKKYRIISLAIPREW